MIFLTKETAQKVQNLLANNLTSIDNSYQELEKVENTLHEKSKILNSYQENINNSFALQYEDKKNTKRQEQSISEKQITIEINKFISSTLSQNNENKEIQSILATPVSDMAMLLVNKKI